MIETIVALPSKITTRTIADISDTIREASLGDAAVVLDAAAVADVDLSFVQLIEAARRDADARARPLTLTAPANASVAALLRRAGFLTAPSAADIDFWFHGALPQ